MNDTNGELLTVKNVVKRFGALTAVNNVSMSINKHDIVGLIGANGAGKTTFFNVVTGNFPPSEGSVFYKGEDITNLSPDKRVARGILRTFQLTATFDELSVLDNMRLSYFNAHRRSSLFNMSASVMNKIHDEIIDRYLEVFELSALADKKTASISLGEKRVLEIAMALIFEPELLLLDEPFAGLSEKEIQDVLDVLNEHAKEQTILIVEHKVTKIKDFVDRICVMVEGEIIGEGEYEECMNSSRVQKEYWKMEEANN